MNDLPCTKCYGLGWAYAGFHGLGGPVTWISKDGEIEKLSCEVCHGRGVVPQLPPLLQEK